jgi:hypothetical protein
MKTAKFFCDSCGIEVEREAKTCPSCGRYFTSVRCPRCGRTGPSSAFKEGCPGCGYSKPLGERRGTPRHAPGPLPLWVWLIAIVGAAAAAIGLIWALRPGA